MKKQFLLTVISALALAFALAVCGRADQSAANIEMQINNPVMKVNGIEKNIDEQNTTPVIVNGRTLVPARAITEAMGGSADWESESGKVTLHSGENTIELTIGSTTALLNSEEISLDSAPEIINGRTMLPLRFIAESLGFDVSWDNQTQTIKITESSITITSTETTSEAAVSADNESKVLIAYFSRAENIGSTDGVDAVSSASLNPIGNEIEGNTRLIADMIQEQTGGDVFSIQTVKKYSSDYKTNVNNAEDELDNNARPELSTHIDNFEQYNIVYLGYPIWWGTMPTAVNTFLEEYDFSGKTVIPFSTHKGSGLGSSVRDIKEALSGVNVEDGFTIAGDDAANSKEDVVNALAEYN